MLERQPTGTDRVARCLRRGVRRAEPFSDGSPATIPQPEPPADVAIAPDGERVDLAMPTFTNPTVITNPLFPVSSQHSVLLLGTVEDQAFRTEVTLLPTTRILQWEGQQVETLVSQYVAFLDGRIEEVAIDLYAQADDGWSALRRGRSTWPRHRWPIRTERGSPGSTAGRHDHAGRSPDW